MDAAPLRRHHPILSRHLRSRDRYARAVDGRVAVLASGAGSNLQAILDDPECASAVVLVVSDRAEAKALDRARSAGVEAVHLDPRAHPSREAHDAALLDLLRRERIDIVCLAGYMRIVGPEIVRAFWGRMLNVHPSLLPAFPGARAVRDALAWGAKVTGCTVHLVDEEVDHGPIVAQEVVPVLEDDDEASLHARIQEAEHRLYPASLRMLLSGRLKVDGRRVVLGDA
jgi:phosphoribosylglycinamide formyltransferase-1